MKSFQIDVRRLAMTPKQRDSLRRGLLDEGLIEAFRSGLADHAIAPESVELGQPEIRLEGDETVIEAPIVYGHELRGSEWAAAEGVVIDVPGTLRLALDPSGSPRDCVCEVPDEEDERAAASFVRGLAARDEIAPVPADPRTLMVQRKPYYIAIDGLGRKRLQRAYYSLTPR